MLRAIVEGQTDVQDLAQLAKGRLVHKLPQLEEALIDSHQLSFYFSSVVYFQDRSTN